jgi:hypothetical protein
MCGGDRLLGRRRIRGTKEQRIRGSKDSGIKGIRVRGVRDQRIRGIKDIWAIWRKEAGAGRQNSMVSAVQPQDPGFKPGSN